MLDPACTAPSGARDKGAVGETQSEQLTTSLFTALFIALIGSYGPLALAWPAAGHLQTFVYGGALLFSLSTGSSVLRDRLLHAPRNWARFPVRSLLEWAIWILTVTAVQRSLVLEPYGAALAALTGCVVCYAGEEATRLVERLRLVRACKTFDMSSPSFFPDGKAIAPAGAPKVSMAEVRKHSTPADCWLVIEDAVLDVTAWAKAHPGSALVLTSLGGRDATDQYKAFHGTSMGARLRALCVGQLDASTAEPPSTAQLEFRALRERLRARGAFSHPLSRTLRPMLLPLALMAAAVCCVAQASGGVGLVGSGAAGGLLLGPKALALLGGCLAGIAWQQMSLFGHDLGHGNVTGSFAQDTVIGLSLLPFFGIGFSWWKATHNTHHVVTNSESHDPDIQHMPLFAVCPTMLRGFYSFYHKKAFDFDPLARALLKWQHVLYYPIMLVAKVNLYVQTHLFLAANWPVSSASSPATAPAASAAVSTATLETLGMLAHYAAIATALGALPSAATRALFFFAAIACGGLLHIQITLSHFAMHTHEGVAYGSNEHSWWHMQLAGTMDIDCHPALDWFHGGLQYQTVHHLFPRLPRFALRPTSAEVTLAAKASGLVYSSVSFARANWLVLQTLRKTALLCASAPLSRASPGAPLLWDSFHARG